MGSRGALGRRGCGRMLHGRCCMAGAAWQVLHGRCCMAGAAWQVLHGRCCMAGAAWQVLHGSPLVKGQRNLSASQQEGHRHLVRLPSIGRRLCRCCAAIHIPRAPRSVRRSCRKCKTWCLTCGESARKPRCGRGKLAPCACRSRAPTRVRVCLLTRPLGVERVAANSMPLAFAGVKA
jgi:hypothetical protein